MNRSRQELLDMLDEQKKTIEKYSSKLRDIVAAHKSILIEKKALEDTIKILSESKSGNINSPDTDKKGDVSYQLSDQNENENTHTDAVECDNDSKSQLTLLLASITNLVTEKSHLEECFKVNQKQLLEEKEAVEHRCKELQEKVKELSKQLKSSGGNSSNDLSFSKKDFQKNFKELSKKEQGKSRALENELLNLQVKNYEKEVKNLKSELEANKMTHELSEKRLKECTIELTKLQEDVRYLQIEHQAALKIEKEKAKNVENHAKKLTAVQEERVVNLETRLAELSETIGTYDRLRLQDQTEIQKLKDHIAHIDKGQKGLCVELQKVESVSEDYDSIVQKICELKKHLRSIAQKNGREEDFKSFFHEDCNKDVSHTLCQEEYNKIKSELDFLKNEMKLFTIESKSTKQVVLQNQIKNLQEKLKVIIEKNKNVTKEYQLEIEQLKKAMKNEKTRFKETLAASELDHRGRVWLLEEQLQKQRERSLALLEEKEQEIHSLQSTFQMLLPNYGNKSTNESTDTNVFSNQLIDGPHIVHYANELARKDIEISNLRRSKHQIESEHRDLQKEIVSLTEKHKEEKKLLNVEISRLERCQSREGANLEYLKNVVYSFLLSSDPKSKRHMCNAIAAVLKFSESELQKVIENSKNKWWTSSNYLP